MKCPPMTMTAEEWAHGEADVLVPVVDDDGNETGETKAQCEFYREAVALRAALAEARAKLLECEAGADLLMDERDDLLGSVERLTRERDALRAKLAAAHSLWESAPSATCLACGAMWSTKDGVHCGQCLVGTRTKEAR